MRKTMIVLAALGLLLAACGGGDGDETGATGGTATGATGETGGECADLTGEGATFTITMGDNFFEPSCFTASASQGISVVNDGAALHSFTMQGTQFDVDVQPGETFNGEAISGVAAPGTYELICKYHTEMTGEVTVVT